MDRFSPVAWVIIIVFILFIVSLNYGLVVLLRDRTKLKMPRMRRNQAPDTFKKITEVVRNPFAEEQSQLRQLSHLVEGLKQPPEPEEDDPNRPPLM